MSRARTLADQFNSDGDLALTPVASVNAGQIGGRRNLIINGAMQVAQRSTSLTVGDSTEYKTLDRWAIGINGTTAGRATMSQSTDAPNGFGSSLKFDVTTADTAIGASESFGFLQRIEGQDLQGLAKGTSDAKTATFSFYAKGTAKTYIVEFRDDNSRQVSATFTVTSSWQRFEIEVPADTTGTIDNDNSAGFIALFWLHAGSDYTSGTLNTSWATSVNANRMVGCESIFSATSNQLLVTGIQLEVGSQASDFEQRSYGEELALCQRYFYTPLDSSGANATYQLTYTGGSGSSGWSVFQVPFPVAMRSNPTLTHNLSNSNGVAAAPASNEWAFYRQNQAYVGSQGSGNMSNLNASTTTTHASCGVYYVSPTSDSSGIILGNGLTFEFASEL